MGCRRTSKEDTSAVTSASVTREVEMLAGGTGPGCGGTRAHSVPVPVPVPTEARCRTRVTGTALALLRSQFSVVFAISPNLLRQEVQMSSNCFHSDGVFSSEAVVYENQRPKICLFYPLHILSVPPPGNCVASLSRSLARDIFSISVSASELTAKALLKVSLKITVQNNLCLQRSLCPSLLSVLVERWKL